MRTRVEFGCRRVQREVQEGTLGSDFDKGDLADIGRKVDDAKDAAEEEVWAGYRYVALAESPPSDDGPAAANGPDSAGTAAPDGLRVIDLGAGLASGHETLCGRVIAALKSEAMLNESVGASYLDRNWPPALREAGAWPLTSLRQSFLNGALTRLLDPDKVLRRKIVEFVGRGDFGLASGPKGDGSYEREWFEELVAGEEVAFDKGVFLLKKATAERLKKEDAERPAVTVVEPEPGGQATVEGRTELEKEPEEQREPPEVGRERVLRLVGEVPPELWNRLGTKVLPKLRSGKDLRVRVELSASLPPESARYVESDLQVILDDLGLAESLRIK